MHNIFFALQPPPVMAKRIAGFAKALSRQRGLDGSALSPERLHISLCSLGEHCRMPEELISKATAAVSNVVMPSFVLSLDRVATFVTKTAIQPVVLFGGEGVIGVDLLHDVVRSALAEACLTRSHGRAMTPHLTLLRDKAEVQEEAIEPLRWRVREFVLIHSPYGQSRHDILGRWPLPGPLSARRS